MSAGTRAEALIDRGNPAETILRAPPDGYSLILIGKHGQNWVATKVSASNTAAVCEGASAPVLMVSSPSQ